jgi:hypothetical protein
MTEAMMSLEFLKRLPDPAWRAYREGVQGSGAYKNFNDFASNLKMIASQRKLQND